MAKQMVATCNVSSSCALHNNTEEMCKCSRGKLVKSWEFNSGKSVGTADWLPLTAVHGSSEPSV